MRLVDLDAGTIPAYRKIAFLALLDPDAKLLPPKVIPISYLQVYVKTLKANGEDRAAVLLETLIEYYEEKYLKKKDNK